MKAFTELSVVRIRVEKTDDLDHPVAAGSTGTIVHINPTRAEDEPAYIVEVLKVSGPASVLVDVLHGELDLVRPYVTAPTTPWLSFILLTGAIVCAAASVLSIVFCANLIRTGSGWGALGFLVGFAPFLAGLPLLLIVIPSAILYRRARRSIDLASLLLSCGTVATTVIEVAVLMTYKFPGSC